MGANKLKHQSNMQLPPKLIREARFGPPKCWKTGAILSSYPRPLLSLQFDQNGNDICTEVIENIPFADFKAWCKRPTNELPPLSTVDFRIGWNPEMTESLTPSPNPVVFPRLVQVINALKQIGSPWKTLMVDSTTGIQAALLGYVASNSPTHLADPRKWAPDIGCKIDQMIVVMSNIPTSHCVFIMHEDTEKNENTSVVQTSPMLYSKIRLFVGGTLSQFFYQKINGGKPTLYTQDTGYIKGIGYRWPDLRLKPVIEPPIFTNIYGELA